MAAARSGCLSAAQVLLDAGADVNGLSAAGFSWPLAAAATAGSEPAMSWLLEHGASLTCRSGLNSTIAHVLAAGSRTAPPGSDGTGAGVCCQWLRRVIAVEPTLLIARDTNQHTPLMFAASARFEAGAATLLELGADVAAVGVNKRTALCLACGVASLPVMNQLIAAGAASEAVLPSGSRQSEAYAAVKAATAAERGCGGCAAHRGGRCSCADGLDMLRAVRAAESLAGYPASDFHTSR
jgi:hypothetical protein